MLASYSRGNPHAVGRLSRAGGEPLDLDEPGVEVHRVPLGTQERVLQEVTPHAARGDVHLVRHPRHDHPHPLRLELLVVLLQDPVHGLHRRVDAEALGDAAVALLEAHVEPPNDQHEAAAPTPAPTALGPALELFADVFHDSAHVLLREAQGCQGLRGDVALRFQGVETPADAGLHDHHVDRRPPVLVVRHVRLRDSARANEEHLV
mmetsp:Transcript_91494/g.285194  ORF Transcript_91494/g.285194 Transcript_91494/m.285194 type:complete len:206 (-) Transcript_91494:82-699(-)